MNQANRLSVLRLAAAADIDPRTARKALEHGPAALRGRSGEKAAEAMRTLGFVTSDDRAPTVA